MTEFFRSYGICPICCTQVTFIADDSWLRDSFLCSKCGSIPRERALMRVIESHFPDWRKRKIHESSPGPRGASLKLATECEYYTGTHFFPAVPPGSDGPYGVRCENLEALTFPDESIDIQVSQDVMEHIFNPELAFREIGRVLAPGGAHIFTVPIVNKFKQSVRRASLDLKGDVSHHLPAQYHGNPIDLSGSLVTFDYGFDICKLIFDSSGLFTHVIQIDDLSNGIRAEYIDVLVTVKPS